MGVNPDRYDRHDRHAHPRIPGTGRPDPRFSPRRKADARVLFNVDISIQLFIIQAFGCYFNGGAVMELLATLGFAAVFGAVAYLLGGMLVRRSG